MKLILFVAVFIISLTSYSQTTAVDSVKAAVNALFDGMKNSDASAIQSAFADSAVLQTISNNKEGKLIIKNESVADFALHNRYSENARRTYIPYILYATVSACSLNGG